MGRLPIGRTSIDFPNFRRGAQSLACGTLSNHYYLQITAGYSLAHSSSSCYSYMVLFQDGTSVILPLALKLKGGQKSALACLQIRNHESLLLCLKSRLTICKWGMDCSILTSPIEFWSYWQTNNSIIMIYSHVWCCSSVLPLRRERGSGFSKVVNGGRKWRKKGAEGGREGARSSDR